MMAIAETPDVHGPGGDPRNLTAGNAGAFELTERLVARLVADARPVRRLAPPMTRALLWLGVVGACSLLAILLFANLTILEARMRRPELPVELAGTLGTGILAIMAAFHLSVPGPSRLWALAPLPTFAIWLGGSGAGCYRQWLVRRAGGWALGDSSDCLMFILGLGLPLGLALFMSLRKAKPLAPLPVALMGGLGAAAIAAFLLQFFHPFDVTFMDLTVHILAVAAVVAISGAVRGRMLDAPP